MSEGASGLPRRVPQPPFRPAASPFTSAPAEGVTPYQAPSVDASAAPAVGVSAQPSFTPAPPLTHPVPPPAQVPPPAASPLSGPPAPRPPRTGPSHRKPSRRARISRRGRMVAVLVVVAGVIAIGLVAGFGTDQSAEPTVESLLVRAGAGE
jgi:hypothetical protein